MNGLAVLVPRCDPGADVFLEGLHAAVIAAAQELFGEAGEPPLDLVDPAGVRRRVVDVEAGMLLKPSADRRALVSAVVVTDEVHVEMLGNVGVDLDQELFELDGAMAAVQRADDRPMRWRSLARVSEPARRRLGRFSARKPSVPTERDWERSVLLEPRSAPCHPELISDGGGLPFPPAALAGSAEQLDPMDPAVGALIAQITRRTASKSASRGLRKRGAAPAPAPPSLDGWRLLVRADDEVLFARGRPPELLTVAVRQDTRRRTWTCVAISAARPLRSTRDGIRASGWRLDPTCEANPEETILRVLVTEQTWAGGQRADSRLLPPDLHVGAEELVLTMFVTPRPGFQTRSPNRETPARIALPHPVGPRRLIDGALYDRVVPGTLPTGEVETDSL